MGSFEFATFEDTAFDVDVPLDAVTISPGFVSDLVAGGAPRQLVATAEYGDSTSQDVTGLAVWSSSDSSVVSVSSTGVVLGISAGNAEVTATYGGFSSTIAVAALVVIDHVAAAIARLPNLWQ